MTDYSKSDIRWGQFSERSLSEVSAQIALTSNTAERCAMVDDYLRAVSAWADDSLRAEATVLLLRRVPVTRVSEETGVRPARLKRILGGDLDAVRADAEPDELDGAYDLRPLVAGARAVAP